MKQCNAWIILATAVACALGLSEAMPQSSLSTAGAAASASATQPVGDELIELLIRKSPWDATVETWSYRTTFLRKGEAIIAHVIAFYSNDRADSPVRINGGEINWQHPSGADITVRLNDKGELVGTAFRGITYSIVYKSAR